MKNFKLQSIALIVFFVTLLTSCSNDNDTPKVPEFVYKTSYVTAVNGPLAGKVNQELSYEVSFTVDNSCGEFNKMTDIELDKLPGYQVEAKYATSCTPPSQTPEVKRTIYKVKSAVKGTYYLRFTKSPTEFITTTVVITE
ncbi:hypothetical protein [Flavobacterium aquidurense]|jgi:hypothetical protein|uniref:hypothetical protein n=1 Tax=Flavobacterium aquidurense TaxID=362413 RepID=UPI00286128B7|nr:hypothetical protein [Flavobacterium aquidurense]MDR7370440.1 hypothetical protein [Flavobacterium aquidurense]